MQEVKDKLNIVEIVGQYIQLRKAGRNYTARCPFHKERTPSFMVSPERGTYICFGCGEKGDAFSFIQKMDGIDFPSALKILADKAGVVLQKNFQAKPENKEKDARLRDVCEASTSFFEETLASRNDVQEYIRNRGLSEETVKTWRVGYVPAQWDALSKHLSSKGFSHDDIVEAGFGVRSDKRPGELFDRFRGRIMFPIFDVAGQVIAVSGRFFEKVPGQKEDIEPAKYINSPETPIFKKSKTLYGFDRAKAAIRKADCILLVEGQFDLLMSHQSGLPFAVALSGTALTDEHLVLLGRISKRLVLALDADAAGLRSGLKSAQMALAAGFDVKIPTFPAGKDPADVARENPELLKAAIRTSKTAVEFFLDMLRIGAKDERAYKRIVETQVLPLIASIASSIDREHFITRVSQRLEVPEAAVRAEVAKRPVVAAAEISSDIHKEDAELSLTPLERAAGMLLSHAKADTWLEGKVEAVLTHERVAQLKEKLEPHMERLRFEFEAQGDDMDTVTTNLLNSLEQAVLGERISALQKSIMSARSSGESTQDMTKELQGLKLREEALRK